METNYPVEAEARQTGLLRSKFNQERKFLSNFYKRNWHHIPSKTDVIFSSILVLLGLPLLFLYSDMSVVYSILIVSSIVTLSFRIYRYFKIEKGWLYIRLTVCCSILAEEYGLNFHLYSTTVVCKLKYFKYQHKMSTSNVGRNFSKPESGDKKRH